jgi:hypothetical protein
MSPRTDIATRGTCATRAARGWVRCYTAGVPRPTGVERRCEIESDLADHTRARRQQGWSDGHITREQLGRLVRGVPADLAWRREALAPTMRGSTVVRGLVAWLTTAATTVVGAFYLVFAAYLWGATAPADRLGFTGFEEYAREPGAAVVACVIAGFGAILVAAGLARAWSPLVANVVTATVASFAVMFFWLGMAPIGAVAVLGAGTDMALRLPRPPVQGQQ